MSIWTIDLDDRYIDLSSTCAAILGYTPDEMLGKTPWEFMPPAEAARVYRRYRVYRQNRIRFHNLANHVIHRGGHLVPLLTSAAPVIKYNKLVGYRGIDIPRNPVHIAKLRLEARGITNPVIWEIINLLCQRSDRFLDALRNSLVAQQPARPLLPLEPDEDRDLRAY